MCVAILQAETIKLDTIAVEATAVVDDVSGEQLKSADLGEALSREVPSIQMVRRSGIANDIIVRGQKKDNINILVDGTKTYGACPNRMDPAISHIPTNNIERVEVITGPFDVENFGTLSGAVKVQTKTPTKALHGELNLNIGSFHYRKASAQVSGGEGPVRMLIGASKEASSQYLDANGDTLAQQLVTQNAPMGNRYLPQYESMDAYDKETYMAKAFIDITNEQLLTLGYTGNRSKNVLYPSSPMDAIYDDSDLFNVNYDVKNLGSFSKLLQFQAYYSQVDHPMSNKYRRASVMMNEITNHLTTAMTGAKIKNITALNDTLQLSIGLDASQRNWDGAYSSTTNPMINGHVSIDHSNTNNIGLFAELEHNIKSLNIKYGLRYDTTKVTTDDATLQDNNYESLNAYVYADYTASKSLSYFGGLGKSSRVPDGRELYFKTAMGGVIGTDTLKQTENVEFDIGMENRYESFNLKTKLFYSMLSNYIYFNSSNPNNNFENIDATIYGIELSGSYYLNDSFYFDMGAAYQRGKKNKALVGQTNTNLAEIPPLKGSLAMNYYYKEDAFIKAEVIAADAWSNFDSDNGEQAINGYSVLNLKAQQSYNNGIAITLGIDNVANTLYQTTNTYRDLTLVQAGGGDYILLNEPGRYFYANLSYNF